MSEIEPKTSPPGIVATLKSGFEFTTKHPLLMIVPLLMDSIYWLGPRLRLNDGLLAEMQEIIPIMVADGAVAATQAEQMVLLLETVGPELNLFSALGLHMLSLPMLMAGSGPADSPLALARMTVDSWGSAFWVIIALGIVGVILGGIYFGLIAHVVFEDGWSIETIGRRLPRSLARYVVFGIATLLMLFGLTVMLSLMLAVILLIGQTAALLVLMVWFFMITWIVIYCSFSIHGILYSGHGVVTAVIESVRFVRRNSPTVIPFVVLIFVLNVTVRTLWLAADDGSLLTFVSIAGHAFIVTAFAVATFIYYRDRQPSVAASTRPL